MFNPSTNPSRNAEIIDNVESTSESEIIHLVERAHIAQKWWRKFTVSKRVKYLEKAYQVFSEKREDLAESIAREMGMPIRQARDEVSYGLLYFRGYLDTAEKYLSDEVTRETDTELHIVSYEPKWVIAAITPWNYPFMLCIWACIQPLLAGNTVVWKISKEVILTGRLIENIMKTTELPEWVWSEIYGDGRSWDFLTDQDIDGITFTGSTQVGRGLAKKAQEKWITAVMELGGSAPGIVMSDADIDQVLESIYFFRFSNAGQMCDGLKRLIVHASRYEEIVEKLSKLLLSKKIGDALDASTDIGPLVSEAQVKHLEEQYIDALASGASVLAEIALPEHLEWAYFAPKILGNITPDMLVWKEEVFWPILPIVIFDTLEEAIRLANDTPYGLGAYIFTQDKGMFRDMAKQIQSGMVQMNTVNYCIPENPFGGRKASGVGSEHGRWGYTEFTDKKVISIPKK